MVDLLHLVDQISWKLFVGPGFNLNTDTQSILLRAP